MGVALALVGAIGFSFMNVFVRKGVRPGDRDNGVLITLFCNASALGLLGVVVVATGRGPAFSVEGLLAFIAAGVAATYLGRVALFGGIRHIGAARAAALKNATPIVTVVIALLFLGERLSLVDGAGVALILVGLFALIAESVRYAPDPIGGADEPDPVEAAFESEAIAEVGLWDRTRGWAGRTAAMLAVPSQRRVAFGVALGLLAAMLIGTGHAFRKVGMDLMPNAVIGAAVGAVTAVALYVAAEAARGEMAGVLGRSFDSFRPWFWAGGIAGSVGQLGFFAALAFAPVSHVSVIAGSETVFTVIFAAILARQIEAITRRVVIPALFVFAGTALIAAAG